MGGARATWYLEKLIDWNGENASWHSKVHEKLHFQIESALKMALN